LYPVVAIISCVVVAVQQIVADPYSSDKSISTNFCPDECYEGLWIGSTMLDSIGRERFVGAKKTHHDFGRVAGAAVDLTKDRMLVRRVVVRILRRIRMARMWANRRASP
jgi:hypothetical protein